MSPLPSRKHVTDTLLSLWSPSPLTETVPLDQAYGRVPAKDYRAAYPIPLVRASKMDGIAVRSADFESGFPDTSKWTEDTDYIRADTGDDFDDRFDTVIKIEDVTFLPEGGISLNPAMRITAGQLVSPSGSSLPEGALIVEKGLPLRSTDLAALVMGGYTKVLVYRKPKVYFQPTGSELVPAGSKLKRGQNFDSNSILTASMLSEMGAEPIIAPIIKDDKDAIRASLEKGLAEADIVIINGGSSKGEEDFNTKMLAERGELLFHGAAAAPGRPIGVALIDGKPVINLSGPSIAAFYGLDWCVRPLVCRLLDTPVPERPKVSGILTEDLPAAPMELLCAMHASRKADGSYIFRPLPKGGSSIVEKLCCNAVFITPGNGSAIRAGSQIEAELLRAPGQIPVEE